MADPTNPNEAMPGLDESASGATKASVYDLPDDEDLSPLDRAQAQESKLTLNWKLSGVLALCLLGLLFS